MSNTMKNNFLKFLAIFCALAAVLALCGFAFGVFEREDKVSSEESKDIEIFGEKYDPRKWQLCFDARGNVPNVEGYDVLECLDPGKQYMFIIYPEDSGFLRFSLIGFSDEASSDYGDNLGYVTLVRTEQPIVSDYLLCPFTFSPELDFGYDEQRTNELSNFTCSNFRVYEYLGSAS